MNEQLLLSLSTPDDVASTLAARARTLRLEQGWKRSTLAERAGVSTASLRRFETTGKASLDLVLRVAFALGRLSEFEGVLQAPPVTSIADLEGRSTRTVPKRGRK